MLKNSKPLMESSAAAFFVAMGIFRVYNGSNDKEVRCVRNRVQLLRAKEEDAPRIQAMQQEAFRELLETYQDYGMSPATEPLEKIRGKIINPGSFYYFIRVGEETVGGIRIVDAGDGSPKRISPLYIMPDCRGKGYAQAAMLEAERIHGAKRWQLDTILQESGNCYLYEKMGYRQTKQRTVINERMTIVGYEKESLP